MTRRISIVQARGSGRSIQGEAPSPLLLNRRLALLCIDAHCFIFWGSARGCPGSTCISLVWLDRCHTSLSLSLLCAGWSRAAATAVSGLAMCACLAVAVFPGLSILVPHLASRVTLAVRADARDVMYIYIYLLVYFGAPGGHRLYFVQAGTGVMDSNYNPWHQPGATLIFLSLSPDSQRDPRGQTGNRCNRTFKRFGYLALGRVVSTSHLHVLGPKRPEQICSTSTSYFQYLLPVWPLESCWLLRADARDVISACTSCTSSGRAGLRMPPAGSTGAEEWGRGCQALIQR